jgi:drug/metabolite transporter (DMT)-like permease
MGLPRLSRSEGEECLVSPIGKAYAYAVSAVLLWSTAASAFKLTLRCLTPLELQAGAVVVAVLFLAVRAAAAGQLRELLPATPRDVARSALLGFLNPFAYYLVLLAAYDRLPAQEALVLNYIWPIVLAVLAVPLLGHPLGRRSVAALVVSFGGVVVIGTRGDLATLRFSDPVGVALAAGSSLIWALYWILSVRDSRDDGTKLLQGFVFGLIYLLISVAATGTPRVVSLRGAIGAVYVGLFEMGVTFSLWLTALRLVDRTARISNLVFLSPFISLLLVHTVLGEPIALSTIGGFTLVVFGIALQVVQPRRSSV